MHFFEFHIMLAFEYQMNSVLVHLSLSCGMHTLAATFVWFCHWNYLFKVHIFNVAYRAWIQWKWQQCIGKKDNSRYHDTETKKDLLLLLLLSQSFYCCWWAAEASLLLSAYANWINKYNGANFQAFLCLFQSFFSECGRKQQSKIKSTFVFKEENEASMSTEF